MQSSSPSLPPEPTGSSTRPAFGVVMVRHGSSGPVAQGARSAGRIIRRLDQTDPAVVEPRGGERPKLLAWLRWTHERVAPFGSCSGGSHAQGTHTLNGRIHDRHRAVPTGPMTGAPADALLAPVRGCRWRRRAG